MNEKKTSPLCDFPIPPVAEVRARLTEVATEATLLRKLLQLALRREREQERLARLYGRSAA